MSIQIRKRLVRISGLLLLTLTLWTTQPVLTQAQCPMCKMTAESNLRNGGSAGQGLNNGILFMLLTPYLIIGVVGFVWYKNKRSEEEVMEDAKQ